MLSPRAAVTGIAVHLPEHRVAVADTEARLRALNPGVVPPPGLVQRLTGVTSTHRMPDHWQASDLAVAASTKLLAERGIAADDVDLLIFASASQDMVEPATAHIVAAKLGVRSPVMDVKNACNSVINAVEVADALVRGGGYRRVLVATGETPTRAVRSRITDRHQYLRSAPGLTMSDAGSALMVEPAGHGPTDAAILASAFEAWSPGWDIGTLPAGGSAHPRDADKTYFDIDGGRLREAFLRLGPGAPRRVLEQTGLGWDDIALVAVHQVAVPYLADIHDALGLPQGKTIVTVADHGNVASVTLPLQLRTALDLGRVQPGQIALLVGLAGGISIGAMAVRL